MTPETITVTELHRHTGQYVERCAAGDVFIVTVRGVPKAMMTQTPDDWPADPDLQASNR